ncbi:hypothetical protein [Methanothrix sp.]|uniref:hypothetical protein n=1 Tax=Methanothrix sp. TaxID=90426 RepID=UPI003C739D6C
MDQFNHLFPPFSLQIDPLPPIRIECPGRALSGSLERARKRSAPSNTLIEAGNPALQMESGALNGSFFCLYFSMA